MLHIFTHQIKTKALDWMRVQNQRCRRASVLSLQVHLRWVNSEYVCVIFFLVWNLSLFQIAENWLKKNKKYNDNIVIGDVGSIDIHEMISMLSFALLKHTILILTDIEKPHYFSSYWFEGARFIVLITIIHFELWWHYLWIELNWIVLNSIF